ncbi:hypothetical protein AMTR_s00052p00203680 [Amborella trichopoda]|uniref:Uncharacterized protein n=1 Tax=Amborella trichopoda TaxID=13333 RepID=U5D210_AMBTC|nr:hypothetical protein AMTR_s00052p00203680 [Amborella trichopoda]
MIERERADNFLRAKEALNASINREGGAFDIETSKQAAASFSLTKAEALHYCLRTKVLDHGCPFPAMAEAPAHLFYYLPGLKRLPRASFSFLLEYFGLPIVMM